MAQEDMNNENLDDSFQAISDECVICKGEKVYSSWVACESCRGWFHLKCLGVKRKDLPKEDYKCTNCQTANPPPPQTTATTTTATISNPLSEKTNGDQQIAGNSNNEDVVNAEDHDDDEDDDDDEEEDEEGGEEGGESTYETDDEGNSEIKEISDWRIKGRSREFKVVYQKDNSSQWFKEKYLENCSLALEAFCVRKRIELPEFIKRMKQSGTFGNVTRDGANSKNWASLEQIKKAVEIYGRGKDSIQPEIFSELRRENQIILMGLSHHCVVVLNYFDKKRCYVADGENIFVKDKPIRNLVLSYLRGANSIKWIPFKGQVGIDHCASSAAVIVIEFQRILATKRGIPKEIRGAASILERSKKHLHSSEISKPINSWKPVNDKLTRLTCPKCGKIFKTKNRGALNLHKCTITKT